MPAPSLLQRTRFLLSEAHPMNLPEAQAEVAFVGRSNVGKSSLLNALCGNRSLARVSSTPGRTRIINVFEAALGRWLVDLPGYGFAVGKPEERVDWETMVEAYLRGRLSLKMIYVLIDAKVGPTKLDASMLQWLHAFRLPWRAVATKSDQVRGSELGNRRKELAAGVGLPAADVPFVSAEKGFGLDALRADVAARLGL